MRKIIFILLCVMLLCITPIVAFAEGDSNDVVETTTTETVIEGEASPTEEDEPITETIISYFKDNIKDFSVIATLIATIIYEIRKHGKLNGSIGTLNNNAIAIVEKSSKTIGDACDKMADMAKAVNNVETFLKTARLAMIEMSNEVAELLVLANIPNSKKEELYARHSKAVQALEAMEEVISNDGKEA